MVVKTANKCKFQNLKIGKKCNTYFREFEEWKYANGRFQQVLSEVGITYYSFYPESFLIDSQFCLFEK